MAKRHEYMKIRQAIINQITQLGGQSTRLPSTRKLAEKFGVSQPTAFKAVKRLIADGYLTPCPGGGTISHNPFALADDTQRHVFGVVCGNGQHAHNGQYFAQLHEEMALRLTRRSWRNAYYDITVETTAELDTVCRQNELSGLILITPTPGVAERARKLKEEGLPVVSLVCRLDGISSFHANFAKRSELAARLLFQEGRTHVVFSSWPGEKRAGVLKQAVEKTRDEFQIPQDQILIQETLIDNSFKQLEALLKAGTTFDGAALDPMFPAHYALFKRYLDVESQCRFVMDECGLFDDLDYSGHIIHYDIATAVQNALDDLDRQRMDPRAPEVYKEMAMSAYEVRSGARINGKT